MLIPPSGSVRVPTRSAHACGGDGANVITPGRTVTGGVRAVTVRPAWVAVARRRCPTSAVTGVYVGSVSDNAVGSPSEGTRCQAQVYSSGLATLRRLAVTATPT